MLVSPTPTPLLDPRVPVPDEIDAFDLPVHGSIPAELTGLYLRNGPNPLPGEPAGHWFAGHGMIHGLGLAGGRATWYRNRWVQTEKLSGAAGFGPGGPVLGVNPANTHIIECGGTLLALCEGGLPYRLTRDLRTVGPYDFDGRLTTAMTAHPKADPITDELFFYGYSAVPPYLTLHVADAAGQLVRSEPIEVAGPTMMHDFAITEHYVVWLDLPVTFSVARWRSGGDGSMPYGWDDGYGARIGVMPRTGGPVNWIDIDPCYVFHVGNATEDAAGRIVLDAVRYSPAAFRSAWGSMGSGSTSTAVHAATQHGASSLHRWRIDPRTRTTTETRIDDRDIEFPSLDDRRTGRPSRYRYAVSGPAAHLLKYDLERDSCAVFDPGIPGLAGEATFVPAEGGRAEDDGWLLSLVTPADGGPSELVVFDATTPGAGPTGRVILPRRVPAGFHGSWLADHR